eukprot:9014230-Alexandrium_andersonii.AAC.1
MPAPLLLTPGRPSSMPPVRLPSSRPAPTSLLLLRTSTLGTPSRPPTSGGIPVASAVASHPPLASTR